MTKTAKGTLKHNNWDEQPYYDSSPQKGTIAKIDIVFDGDLQGDAKTVYAMAYHAGGNTHYAGHLLFKGKLGIRQGTFTIYELGVDDGGRAKSSWEIVKGSGTGDFEGITGTGSYEAGRSEAVHYALDYELK